MINDQLVRRIAVYCLLLEGLMMHKGYADRNASLESTYATLRLLMVETQIENRGVKDSQVLQAMRKVPRHLFVPANQRQRAYEDYPIPIGHDQTISQPYIVAKMTELAQLKKGSKVLEIGTGSGYQAAVLAEMGAHVYSVEIIKELSDQAHQALNKAGYKNVSLKVGDGYQGWRAHAPFDAIVVTAAPEKVPQPLVDQLKKGGVLVIPVGRTGWFEGQQELVVVSKTDQGVQKRSIIPVAFVPMTGEGQKSEP